MERLSLRQALSVLSKSSSYAVSTDTELSNSEYDLLKKCLYVSTDIEEAFKNKLCDLDTNSILFLCGSSGDGKSELLTKYKKKHEQYVDFHLDATHSFGAKTSAIQTLDNLFTTSKSSGRALVVGVNVGMLGNYEKEGSDEHVGIRAAIEHFLEVNANAEHGQCEFLSFESFPKFVLDKGTVRADFFKSILNRVVRDDSSNKFNDYFK
jgi:DNA phosphorothioation-dependent restriction protein DptF